MNSEFNWKQVRDIITSGIIGHNRREIRKQRRNLPKYRSGQMSLKTRVEKKLLEKYNWFRLRKESEKEEDSENDKLEKKVEKKWNYYKCKKPPINALEAESKIVNQPPKAVLFVQHTVNSDLANAIRKVILDLRPWTGINIKVVERVGDKLEDLLHRSDPWGNSDCGRLDCFSCESSAKNDDQPYKNCHKRSVVYESWCQTCLTEYKNAQNLDLVLENTDQNPENSDSDIHKDKVSDHLMGELVTANKRKIENDDCSKAPLYRYIGETSRSFYERGQEHKKDLEYYRPKSHLLRHEVEKHPNLYPTEIDFRAKILLSHMTAFERQLSQGQSRQD